MTNKEITCPSCGNKFYYASTMPAIICQQCKTPISVPEEDRLFWEDEVKTEQEAAEGGAPDEAGI